MTDKNHICSSIEPGSYLIEFLPDETVVNGEKIGNVQIAQSILKLIEEKKSFILPPGWKLKQRQEDGSYKDILGIIYPSEETQKRMDEHFTVEHTITEVRDYEITKIPKIPKIPKHRIPPITDPLGKHWDQPDRSKIQIIDDIAIMSRTTFFQLANYEYTLPTGAYIGKMWRRDKKLCWYDAEYTDSSKHEKYLTIEYREIKITMTDVEFCQVVIEWAKEYLGAKGRR